MASAKTELKGTMREVERQGWRVGKTKIHAEDAAESFLEGFLEKHPETGPVVSQNREAGTITVTFSPKAGGQKHALNLGQVVWVEGGAASGLEPTRVVRAEIEPVEDAAEDQAPVA